MSVYADLLSWTMHYYHEIMIRPRYKLKTESGRRKWEEASTVWASDADADLMRLRDKYGLSKL